MGKHLIVLIVHLVALGVLGSVAYLFREVLPLWAKGAMVAVPILTGLILFFSLKEERSETEAPKEAPKEKEEKEIPSPPPEPTPREEASGEALVASFLGALQREGRFLDFLSENLDQYDDAQIGAAVRSIHRGLRAVVFEMVELEPVIRAREGSEVVVEEGFNPKEIKLIGQVKGKPPFKGVLRHGGWRYRRLNLPKPRKDQILAPAEVEVS